MIGCPPAPFRILDAQPFLPELGGRKLDLLTRPAVAERDHGAVLGQQENVCPPGNTPRVPAALYLKRLGIGGQTQLYALNTVMQRFTSSSLTVSHTSTVF